MASTGRMAVWNLGSWALGWSERGRVASRTNRRVCRLVSVLKQSAGMPVIELRSCSGMERCGARSLATNHGAWQGGKHGSERLGSKGGAARITHEIQGPKTRKSAEGPSWDARELVDYLLRGGDGVRSEAAVDVGVAE